MGENFAVKMYLVNMNIYARKCPYSEFCWSVFVGIQTEHGDSQSKNAKFFSPISYKTFSNIPDNVHS